ncbi:MAG TPA: YlxR family protein [Lacisediminihabitans sp.]|nr:YlxR family protein [Lacisediminihabitans sp.]HXD60726.1 YlxR family protein [Lacisediminihabitans sp.]
MLRGRKGFSMSGSSMEPVRTCLGCRKRDARSSLLRVVARNGEVIVDRSASLPGRGAWVHPTLSCIETSIARKAFGRALRVDGPLRADGLIATVGVSSETPERTG